MKLIFFVITTIILNFSFAQNVSCDQIQNLRKKSLADVESFLTEKGWSVTNTEVVTDKTMAEVTFGYKIDLFDNEKAVSWIKFYESEIDNLYNRISIQISIPSIYSIYLTRLGATGFKIISSKIVEDGIRKIYKNSSTTCIVTITTTEGRYTKATAYKFFFLTNTSYKLNFENDE